MRHENKIYTHGHSLKKKAQKVSCRNVCSFGLFLLYRELTIFMNIRFKDCETNNSLYFLLGRWQNGYVPKEIGIPQLFTTLICEEYLGLYAGSSPALPTFIAVVNLLKRADSIFIEQSENLAEINAAFFYLEEEM